MDQECRQCGRCCERWGWGQKGTAADLVPWIEGKRWDILVHVAVRLASGRWVRGDAIQGKDIPSVTRVSYWHEPSGLPLRSCPFLGRGEDGRAFCAIHAVRPSVCREYEPWNCTGDEFLQVRCPACREMMP